MKVEPKGGRRYSSLAIACSQELHDKVAAIASRDGTTRSDAARQLIEFALPYFERETAGEETRP